MCDWWYRLLLFGYYLMELRFARKDACEWVWCLPLESLMMPATSHKPHASSLVYRHSRIVYDYDVDVRCRVSVQDDPEALRSHVGVMFR